eukprot:sb/3469920/
MCGDRTRWLCRQPGNTILLKRFEEHDRQFSPQTTLLPTLRYLARYRVYGLRTRNRSLNLDPVARFTHKIGAGKRFFGINMAKSQSSLDYLKHEFLVKNRHAMLFTKVTRLVAYMVTKAVAMVTNPASMVTKTFVWATKTVGYHDTRAKNIIPGIVRAGKKFVDMQPQASLLVLQAVWRGGRTLVLTDSLSKFKADSISKNGLFIYNIEYRVHCRLRV